MVSTAVRIASNQRINKGLAPAKKKKVKRKQKRFIELLASFPTPQKGPQEAFITSEADICI